MAIKQLVTHKDYLKLVIPITISSSVKFLKIK